MMFNEVEQVFAATVNIDCTVLCNDEVVSRKYEQRKRAERQDETRRRIVRATVELHGLVGPSRTTVSAVAERAGVQRNTLYRHFPDDRSLVLACTALFTGENPLPEPASWEEIGDPAQRVAAALSELYGFWERHAQLVGNVLRDAETDELIRQVSSDTWGTALAGMGEVLVAAWPDDRRTDGLRAAVDLALAFRTWQSLVQHSGLTSAAAARLMAHAVAAVADQT
jgi:AcrR family transcriptional regulator